MSIDPLNIRTNMHVCVRARAFICQNRTNLDIEFQRLWYRTTAMKLSFIDYGSGSQTFLAADPFCCEIFFADPLAA